MEKEFATDDIRDVFSKILKFVDESESEDFSYQEVEKPAKSVKKRGGQLEKKEAKVEKKETKMEKPVKKISIGQFNSTTYARMQARQHVVDEKLKKKVKAIEDKVNENLKSKPDINKSSRKINILPLSQRSEEIIELKRQKISRMSEQINKERTDFIEKELTFHPCIIKDPDTSAKDFEGILSRMKEYEGKKNIRAMMKKEEVEEKMKEILTFKPNLCENSVRLMADLGAEHRDVVLRLFEMKKTPVPQEVYSFTPTLTQSSKRIRRNQSETDVFARLYTTQKDFSNLNLASETNLLQNTD